MKKQETFIKEYTIVEFRDFKPIKDFDMIKMTLEEWNNLKKWKKLEVENNIIEIEEKDFEIRCFDLQVKWEKNKCKNRSYRFCGN